MGDTNHGTTEPATILKAARTRVWPPLAIALSYYLGARVGFALTLVPVPVSTLWPPNAILLAGLLLTQARSWPLVLGSVLVAHLAVQFQSGVPAAMVVCWFVSNCTEALIGATLLRRFGQGARTFETFGGTATFFVCAGLTAPFLSSFLDAAFVVANQWGDAGYWTIWRTRFFSNVLATLTLVPVILMTADRVTRLWDTSLRRVLELTAGLLALAALCWLVFVHEQPGPGSSPALLYTPLLLLAGAAVRFGPWGTAVAILTCALIAIQGAILGQGPFITSSAAENALSIQMFLIVTWIPLMSLSAVIRERESANANARRSEEQLAIAIEAAQLGRWEWDIGTNQLTWSDITRRIYEVPLDVPVGPETFEALVHPDDQGLIAAATIDALSGRAIDVEFRVRFPDGRIKWILSKATPICDEAGHPTKLIGVKVDITKRKAAELEIQAQQRELAHSSRVAMADELSAALAHEVNQPLAAILANASAARRFLTHTPPNLRELAAIVEAIADDNRRAAAVISRFGTLMKKQEAPWSPIAIDDVIRSVIDVARYDVISRGVSLSHCLQPGLPPVLGDSLQIQQVLLNLILNACDAMESVAPADRRLLLSASPAEDGGVRVTVSDTGVGVPDDLEPMFEPFVTSKPQRLGLGLAISRSIVSAHNGHLCGENQAAGGAAFSFTLPAAPADAAPSGGTPASPAGREHVNPAAS